MIAGGSDQRGIRDATLGPECSVAGVVSDVLMCGVMRAAQVRVGEVEGLSSADLVAGVEFELAAAALPESCRPAIGTSRPLLWVAGSAERIHR